MCPPSTRVRVPGPRVFRKRFFLKPPFSFTDSALGKVAKILKFPDCLLNLRRPLTDSFSRDFKENDIGGEGERVELVNKTESPSSKGHDGGGATCHSLDGTAEGSIVKCAGGERWISFFSRSGGH